MVPIMAGPEVFWKFFNVNTAAGSTLFVSGTGVDLLKLENYQANRIAMKRNNRQEQRDEANGPKIVDKSEALFSMYIERADIDDEEENERWKKECDNLLEFVLVFSPAALSISITDLQ